MSTKVWEQVTLKIKHGDKTFIRNKNDKSVLCKLNYTLKDGTIFETFINKDFLERIILAGLPRKNKKMKKKILKNNHGGEQ